MNVKKALNNYNLKFIGVWIYTFYDLTKIGLHNIIEKSTPTQRRDLPPIHGITSNDNYEIGN